MSHATGTQAVSVHCSHDADRSRSQRPPIPPPSDATVYDTTILPPPSTTDGSTEILTGVEGSTVGIDRGIVVEVEVVVSEVGTSLD
ncbi:MAG: hypothetical protein M5U19_18795 [Microthrixaceae bacterium]|nr:hypothetical protein [Microthrixaceae bacterium]